MFDGGIATRGDGRQFKKEMHALKSQLSENRRLEEQLRQSQKMEALANLAGGIAHDFNNILQTILCYMQLAVLKSGEISQEETYRRIETIIQKGSNLARQLMVFGRRNGSETSLLDLNGRIRETRTILARTIPKMIELELELDSHLPMIDADGGQIDQVLMNLGINAKDAMPDFGKIIFRTENVLSKNDPFLRGINADADHYVLLTVSDTGCGIPEKDMAYVFEPFFTNKRKGEGTGLGLSMVYTIVRNHGGFIDCTSQVGKGTLFRIYFPAAKAGVHTSKRVDLKRKEEVPGGKESILLVDDETTILEVWGELLERYGYRVKTAAKGEEAISVYAESAFDLVILDVNMPGMGGVRFLQKLIRMDPGAKVVISSGYSLDGLVKKALKIGAKVFLPKPYSITQLLNTLRQILDAGEARGIDRMSLSHPLALETPRPVPVLVGSGGLAAPSP